MREKQREGDRGRQIDIQRLGHRLTTFQHLHGFSSFSPVTREVTRGYWGALGGQQEGAAEAANSIEMLLGVQAGQ